MPQKSPDEWDELKFRLIIALYCVLSFLAGFLLAKILPTYSGWQ